MAGGFGLGIAAQHAHDQHWLAQLRADNRQLRQARDEAQREAQDSAAQATEAREQASKYFDEMTHVQATASNDLAAKVQAADQAGFMRGFCTVAFAIGTPKATLGQVVQSIDDSLWSACDDGIGIALKVSVQPNAAAPMPPTIAPALPPSLPLPVFGGILCSDGSVSHAAHRQGACSWHGGIAG